MKTNSVQLQNVMKAMSVLNNSVKKENGLKTCKMKL